jgi:hypothetical protein
MIGPILKDFIGIFTRELNKTDHNLLSICKFREFRDRRLSTTSTEASMPKQRRLRRPKSQNSFYPCPPQSFSEADQYLYSDDDDEVEEEDDRSTDDGFISTLVSFNLSGMKTKCTICMIKLRKSS